MASSGSQDVGTKHDEAAAHCKTLFVDSLRMSHTQVQLWRASEDGATSIYDLV